MNYSDFLNQKAVATQALGFEPLAMNPRMRADQRIVTDRALRAGRYAIFADCGLGKTLDELEYAKQVVERHGPVLILAPLCVGVQTKHIAESFGYDVRLVKSDAECTKGINVCNYERLDKLDASRFAGVVLDESSILKNFNGKTLGRLLDLFQRTRFKLACTATPAPNDYTEIGNHAEFLGVMRRSEMLSMFFVHDGGETQTWRLKGHAQQAFWDWVASWSTTYRKPSEVDPQCSDEGFNLPPLSIVHHTVELPANDAGYLFSMPAETLGEQRRIKRTSIDLRVAKVAELVPAKDYCVIWADLNDEADALVKAIPGSVQIQGSDAIERKEEILWAFTNGEIKHLVTKEKITSFGLNWQHCNTTVFAGPNYSYEAAYQAICRFHRFGQMRPVTAHWVLCDLEYNVFLALREKMERHEQMREALKCAV